jgi:hypothetical protein
MGFTPLRDEPSYLFRGSPQVGASPAMSSKLKPLILT